MMPDQFRTVLLAIVLTPLVTIAAQDSAPEALEDWRRVPIGVQFEEAPFLEVIDFLSAVGKVNIVVDPHVAEELERQKVLVTLSLRDTPLGDALELLLDLHRLRLEDRDSTLVITDARGVRGRNTDEIVVLMAHGNDLASQRELEPAAEAFRVALELAHGLQPRDEEALELIHSLERRLEEILTARADLAGRHEAEAQLASAMRRIEEVSSAWAARLAHARRERPEVFERELGRALERLEELQRLREEAPELYRLECENLSLSLEVEELARSLQAGGARWDSQDAQKLEQMLGDLFDLRMRIHEHEIARRVEELEELQEMVSRESRLLHERRSQKDSLVEQRLKDLLGGHSVYDW